MSESYLWLGDLDSEVVSLNYEQGCFGCVVIPKQESLGHFSARICILAEAQKKVALTSQASFDRWVLSSGLPKEQIESIRLIGNLEDTKRAEQLKDNWKERSPGKSIVISEQVAIHFLPREGKVRMPKGVVRNRKTRVLVVDDSETIRKILSRIISEDPTLECVGAIDRPSQVEKAIIELKPDVMTLDIHMPEMNGVELLRKIMPKFRIPTVMISSFSKEDGTFVLDALEAGAVDYIQKPSMQELKIVASAICEKIRNAACAVVSQSATSLNRVSKRIAINTNDIDLNFLIAIGSSTGGTEALKTVLTALPSKIPPIVIVQHIPPVFSKAFADRMNSLCAFQVKEAEDGDIVEPSKVLIAPGGKQMKIISKNGQLKILIDDSAPVNRHKPSVDVMFDSVVQLPLTKVTAAILTGMGADGAKGLLKLRKKGAATIAQDEATSVVYGMPREAAKIGAAEKILPLQEIAHALLESCSIRSKRITRAS